MKKESDWLKYVAETAWIFWQNYYYKIKSQRLVKFLVQTTKLQNIIIVNSVQTLYTTLKNKSIINNNMTTKTGVVSLLATDLKTPEILQITDKNSKIINHN